ncbi:Imm50 family immunity protein, partial [Leptospira sp. SA-E8]|uniref:Imm50 family immunity protein n=1 Tax=Leptospira sp. SA-E8 TaxID=3422259 RepID=UPI003EBB6FB5
MDWSELLENQRALLAYYEAAPSLEGVTLHSLTFLRNGPCAELVIDPSVFPSLPSARWPVGSNKCQMTLRLHALKLVEMNKWGTGVIGDVTISRRDGDVELEFSGEAVFR